MNGFGLLLAELHKKERSACAKRSNLAGAVRFELTTKVLETHVLPLHHAPKQNNNYYSSLWDICQGEIDPFFYFQEKAGIRAQPRSF